MGVMFLPSLLGGELNGREGDGVDGGDTRDATKFTCTPGEMGLTQRLPLSYGIPAGKAIPLAQLPLPYVLPGEGPGEALFALIMSGNREAQQ